MTTVWTCKACTWSNDDATTSCVMCQTVRPRWKFASAAGRERALAPSSFVEASKPASVAAAAALESSLDGEKYNQHRTRDYKRDFTGKIEQDKNRTAATKSQWDAFATLQSNYESSSDDESNDDDSENHRSETGSDFDHTQSDGQSVHGGKTRWDAFESLQSNYQSSEESDTASEHDIHEDRTPLSPSSLVKSNHVEFIDLVDSDDENKNRKLHANADKSGKRRLDLIDSEEEQSPHSSRPILLGKKRMKRISNDTVTKRKSHITLFDDSSISEQESSRPSPAGVTRSSRSSGILPPWQRSIPIQQNRILSGNKTLPSSSFSCMNGRNDVSGGSGAGVNGFRMSRTEDDGNSDPQKRAKSVKGAKKKTTSLSRGEEDDPKKTKQTRPKGKRRYRRRGRSGTTSGATTKRGAQRQSTNDPWSSRERGIRQRNNHSRGSATSTYMMIGKQETALRSIGGATVTF